MPMQFGLTPDQLVRHSVDNAVTYLWQGGGVAHLKDLKLKSSGQDLIVPDDHTLLLMGITDELTAELGTVKAAGITRFANESQRDGLATMSKYGARRRTTEGGKTSANMPKVTLVALHAAGAAGFGKSWTWFGKSTPSITVDALLAELPLIKQRD